MKIELITEFSEIVRALALIRCVAFSPNAKLLASSGSDSIIRFWEVATKKEVAQISLATILKDGRGEVNSIAFSSDGQFFAACGNSGSFALFQASNLELITEFILQKKTKLSESQVVFSPCSKYLTVVGWNNCLRIVDLETQTLIQQINVQGWLNSVAFHPTKKLLAIGGSNFTRLLDFEKVSTYCNPPKKISIDTNKLGSHIVVFSSDGKSLALACYDDAVRIYDIDKKQPYLVCSAHRGSPSALAWHPQNNLFISGDDRFIYLWDGVSGELLTKNDSHLKQISSLEWSLDGQLFASASWDRSIKLWQIV